MLHSKAIQAFSWIIVPGRGLGHDSRETSLARSRPRLTARPAGLARSGFLVLPQSQ